MNVKLCPRCHAAYGKLRWGSEYLRKPWDPANEFPVDCDNCGDTALFKNMAVQTYRPEHVLEMEMYIREWNDVLIKYQQDRYDKLQADFSSVEKKE